MKKIKVLQIGLSYKAGGIEFFLLNYQKFINYDKIQMDYVNCFEQAKKEQFYENLKKFGRIYDLPDYRKYPLKFLKEFRKINNIEHYDILHYNMNSAVYLLPLIAAKINGIKTIISHSHNSSSDKGIIKKVIHAFNKRFIPIFANTYFACSKLAGKWFFSSRILKNRSFYVINNAIDTEKFIFNDEVRKRIRKNLNIDNDTVVIGHVGRFKKQKNHKFLIEIFDNYHKINKNSVLVLVGYGPLEDAIKQIAKDRNIVNNIIFLGKRDDVNEIMQGMDIFILPSLYEGLPTVGVEAQISGLPCIFSDSITRETKINDNVQFITLKKDSIEWANIISRIDIKSYNRKNVNLEEFDIKNNAKRLENIYINLNRENGGIIYDG